MKIYFLITFFCIFSISAENIYSQSKTVSTELKNVTLKDAFRELEKSSDYLFLFMDNIEKGLSTNVNVSFHNKSMGEILDFLLKNTDLTYSVVNRQVTISKKPDIGENKKILKVEQPAVKEVQQTHKTIAGTITDANADRRRGPATLRSCARFPITIGTLYPSVKVLKLLVKPLYFMSYTLSVVAAGNSFGYFCTALGNFCLNGI